MAATLLFGIVFNQETGDCISGELTARHYAFKIVERADKTVLITIEVPEARLPDVLRLVRDVSQGHNPSGDHPLTLHLLTVHDDPAPDG